MLKSNKVIKILIILATSILLIGIVINKFSDRKFQKVNQNLYRYNDIDFDTKKISNCIKGQTCSISVIDFRFIKTTNKSEVLRMKFDEINQKTLQLYNESINSNTNTSECSAVANIYKHRIVYQNLFHVYEDDEFISVAVDRIGIDFCAMKDNYLGIETYYYDIKKNKFITQEEILSKFPITNIEKSIKKSIEQENSELDRQYTYDNVNSNYSIYFDSDGVAFVSYKHNEDGQYSDAKLDFKIK